MRTLEERLADVLHDAGSCNAMFAHYGPAKKCKQLAEKLVPVIVSCLDEATRSEGYIDAVWDLAELFDVPVTNNEPSAEVPHHIADFVRAVRAVTLQVVEESMHGRTARFVGGDTDE